MLSTPFRVGFLLFPRLTQLDLTGPFEVLARMPEAEIHLVAKDLEPVRSDRGLGLLPTTTFAACPPLDLLCVPGGPGVNDTLVDAELLGFVRRIAGMAQFVTSVCTGSLTLGAAGLLRGRVAACHWASRHLLADFGATPSHERVVVDGKLITGGGVTAGIDFALAVVALLHGRAAAEAIQLQIEYDPEPPFDAGTPEHAPPAILQQARRAAEPLQRARAAAVRRAAAALAADDTRSERSDEA
jgi:cyclohexyl-isocyanide hydratase